MIDENCLCSGEVDDVNEVDLSVQLELAPNPASYTCGLPLQVHCIRILMQAGFG